MNNAFELLKIDKTASKKEILHKVTEALRSRKYNAKQIVEAQKRLFNPVTRAAETFKYFLDVDHFAGPLQADEPAQETPDLPLLDIFDA